MPLGEAPCVAEVSEFEVGQLEIDLAVLLLHPWDSCGRARTVLCRLVRWRPRIHPTSGQARCYRSADGVNAIICYETVADSCGLERIEDFRFVEIGKLEDLADAVRGQV